MTLKIFTMAKSTSGFQPDWSLRGHQNLPDVPQIPLAPSWLFDNPIYVTLVNPGIAIVGVASGPHSYFGGVKSSVEFMA